MTGYGIIITEAYHAVGGSFAPERGYLPMNKYEFILVLVVLAYLLKGN